jgi:hypothetical protein
MLLPPEVPPSYRRRSQAPARFVQRPGVDHALPPMDGRGAIEVDPGFADVRRAVVASLPRP